MQKIKLIFYSLVLSLIATGFIFRVEITDYFRPQVEQKFQELEQAATDAIAREVKKFLQSPVGVEPEVSAPPPLRVPFDALAPQAAAELTATGIVEWTNVERAAERLDPLAVNLQLNEIAKLRVQDMFARQYFSHTAPSGEEVGDVAEDRGYKYIVLGENLALGNFLDNRDVVDAWMKSPGHRENILNGRYAEIGVAAQEGFFEGRKTWMAVQVFGKPAFLCSFPDQALKESIEELNADIEIMFAELEERRADIERTNQRSPQYNQKVNEYNELVARYNSLVQQVKAMAASYNEQVRLFNECVTE